MSATRDIHTGFIETNGARLYFEMQGQGPSLILLHGGYMDTKMWDDQFASFAANHQVVRYDLRGHGKSTLPQRSYAHMVDALMADKTLVPSSQYAAARERVKAHLLTYSFAYFLEPAPKRDLVPSAYERLGDLHVPTLLIVGKDDHFHLRYIAETLENRIDGAKKIMLSETHHMPNMEKPEEFNQIILDFLDTL